MRVIKCLCGCTRGFWTSFRRLAGKKKTPDRFQGVTPDSTLSSLISTKSHVCASLRTSVCMSAAAPTAVKRSMQPPSAGSWPPAATVWEWEAVGGMCVLGRADRSKEGMSEKQREGWENKRRGEVKGRECGEEMKYALADWLTPSPPHYSHTVHSLPSVYSSTCTHFSPFSAKRSCAPAHLWGGGGPQAVWALTCPLFTHTQMYTHTNTEELMCKTHSDPACWWWKAGSNAPVLMPEGKTWEKPTVSWSSSSSVFITAGLVWIWANIWFLYCFPLSPLMASTDFLWFSFYWILADTSQQQVSSWGL